MIASWDGCWRQFESRIALVLEELRRIHPAAVVQIGNLPNEVFVLGAYASFSPQRSPFEERVVVAMSCARRAGNLVGTVDITKGDGQMLVIGPDLLCTIGGADVDSDVGRWCRSADQFIRANAPVVIAQFGPDEA